MQAPLVDPGVLLLIFNLLSAWPVARICQRAGFDGRWALVVFVPVVGLVIVLGLLALRPWPARPLRPTPPPPKPRRTA